jgi:hypothetical protein
MSAWVTLASGVFALPGTAEAVQCIDPMPRVPDDGATAVPTNAVLWGYGRGARERLLGPDGEVVPVERRTVSVAEQFAFPASWYAYPVLVPIDPLAPDTRYTLESDAHPLASDEPTPLGQVTFTTGSGPSLGVPPLPVLLDAETHARTFSEILPRLVTLEFEHQGLLIADVGNLGAATSLDDLYLADSDLPYYEPVTGGGIEWATTRQTLTVGVSDCTHWGSAADRLDARFGVLDLAGNFSGWVDVELEIPSREEAEAAEAAAAEAARKRLYGPREGRPSVCTFAPARSEGAAGLCLFVGVLGAAFWMRRRGVRWV